MNHFILLCSLLAGSFNTKNVMNISIFINRNADEVYAFISNPENLPEWAAGLDDNVKKTWKP